MNVKQVEKVNIKQVFSVIDLTKYNFAEGKEPAEIQILGCGKWNHPQYGPIVIEPRDITEFKENFEAGLRRDICITEGHETMDEKPAIGWIRELIDKGLEGLFATMEWTKQGKTLLAEKQYKYFSPEFYSEYEDPETRQIYENVLVGGALTNKPYFKTLQAVVLSEHGLKNPHYQFNDTTNMELKDIVVKNPGELSTEEQTFLREKQGELTDDQKATFESILSAANPEAGRDENGEAEKGKVEGDAEGAPAPTTPPAPVEASENMKGKRLMSEAEIKILEEKANKGELAFAELEKRNLSERVDKMTFSESNKDGKFLPKQKDAVVSFLKSLSEPQRDQFVNIVNNLPKVGLFSEIGDGAMKSVNAFKEIEAAIKEKIKASETSGKKMTYSEAMKEVKSESPDLFSRYEEELAASNS